MLNIVTGKINSGKTTYLKKLYETTQKGDGFLCLKFFDEETHIGYDLFHLVSGERVPFIRLKTNLPKDWYEIFEIGKYSFSKEGFEFAKNIIKNAKEEPLYIDEIGPLEINQQSGFYELLKTQMNKELYITVREDLYVKFLRTFDITQKINKITIE